MNDIINIDKPELKIRVSYFQWQFPGVIITIGSNYRIIIWPAPFSENTGKPVDDRSTVFNIVTDIILRISFASPIRVIQISLRRGRKNKFIWTTALFQAVHNKAG